MSSEQEERIKRLFLLEAEEHLQTLENMLVDLKATMADSESVNEMYRAAHSVKGGAAMLGFNSVNKIAHRLEDCFKIIKDNPVDIDNTIESQFIRGYDVLKELVEKIQDPYGLRDEEGEEIVSGALPLFEELENHLNSLASGGKPPAKTAASKSKIPANFASQVKGELKEVLQVFKKGESPATRKQLVAAGDRLIKLGAGIEKWESLIKTAQRAMANSKNSYKVLAPVIIKEINQAGEMVQAGKAASLTPTKDLQKLAPAAAEKAATPTATATAKPAAAAQPALPKEPKEVVKLLIRTFNKKELQEIAKYLVNHVKKSSKS